MSVGEYRKSRGRIGAKAKGASPVLILTVHGRKSGQPFSTPVAYFERAGGLLVVGSVGGLPQEPHWFKNLRATPRAVVELGDRRRDVTVRVLEGAAGRRLRSASRRKSQIQRPSDDIRRVIPVALLIPR